MIWCLVVNESDIYFNSLFLSYVDRIQKVYPGDHQYMLVGTAGGFADEEKISPKTGFAESGGEAFDVDTAFKVDRGKLADGPNNTVQFKLRASKIARQFVSDEGSHTFGSLVQ